MYETARKWRDEDRMKEEMLTPSPSCTKCIHMKMCKIAGNMFPMMDSMFGMLKDKDKPFKPEDIAKLCQWYETPEFTEPVRVTDE